MTKIYTYCLFDGDDTFHGVYSSLAAVYRDAIKIANQGQSRVVLQTENGWVDPDLTTLRNVLYSKCDVVVLLQGGRHKAKILKTRLKE
tara:strand:- start:6661 stop:6924 length:264 start_codon:yes stop_codon:yes gene_type:complete